MRGSPVYANRLRPEGGLRRSRGFAGSSVFVRRSFSEGGSPRM